MLYGLSFILLILFLEDEEEEVHLVPGSSDDAPRAANPGQGSNGNTDLPSSRPSGRVIGIIKRNWHS